MYRLLNKTKMKSKQDFTFIFDIMISIQKT